jgi:hypothetical protein
LRDAVFWANAARGLTPIDNDRVEFDADGYSGRSAWVAADEVPPADGREVARLRSEIAAMPDHELCERGGEEYSLDPIGPSFDPDVMLAALRAGTPESELTIRAWAGVPGS